MLRALVALASSALLVAFAMPARAAVPGVTDTEVTIGITGPLSGPAAAWGSIALASEAYAKHVNDNGGVHGRKLKIVIKDDSYHPGKAVANMNEMKDQVFAMIGTVGTAVLNATKDIVADSGMPFVLPLGNVQVFAKMPKERIKNVFQAYPDYVDEGEWIIQQAVKLENVKKVAVFGQNDDYGKGGLEGVKKGIATAKLQGVSVTGEVFYEVTDRELGTHALKLKESGADAVILYSTPVHAAGVVKEMAKVGYRPKLFASFTLYDRDTMFRLLGDLWEGAYYNAISAPRGTPPADKIIDIITKIDPKLKGREGFLVQGAADVIVLVEGLKRAGRDLTREKFVKALEGFKDVQTEGLLPPLTWSPNQHHAGNNVRMMRALKASDSSFKQVTDFAVFKPHF